ncbi:hypothetical protein OEA41_009503 [Lepraria neglecta]|uniref:Uncharacterized protein n=1 Tax=Lepraria neglecta TaxID=209136 RepID=A0AAD9Z4E5_9LECA|nr:hypothetical protein OEA41_009503 [Lepraria neglecta]
MFLFWWDKPLEILYPTLLSGDTMHDLCALMWSSTDGETSSHNMLRKSRDKWRKDRGYEDAWPRRAVLNCLKFYGPLVHQVSPEAADDEPAGVKMQYGVETIEISAQPHDDIDADPEPHADPLGNANTARFRIVTQELLASSQISMPAKSSNQPAPSITAVVTLECGQSLADTNIGPEPKPRNTYYRQPDILPPELR